MRLLAVVMVVVAVLLFAPEVSVAAPWPLETRQEPLLPFAAEYPYGEGTRRHTGIDLACDAGTSALSCWQGTVTFSGRIPAGEGASTLAVTVQRDDGIRITYLPLTSIEVSEGELVPVGAVLGHVAAEGDVSSSTTHLHVSIRRGDEYLNPLSLLPCETPVSDPEGQEKAVPAEKAPTDSLLTKEMPAPSAPPAAAFGRSAAEVPRPEVSSPSVSRVRERCPVPAGASERREVTPDGRDVSVDLTFDRAERCRLQAEQALQRRGFLQVYVDRGSLRLSLLAVPLLSVIALALLRARRTSLLESTVLGKVRLQPR